MKIHEVLSRLEDIENTMADLYEWLSEVFEADSEASGLFFRMSLQEKSHASLLKYGKNLVRRSPDEFDDVDFDAGVVEALVSSVDEFRAKSPAPSLAEALFFSMQVECHPAENSHRDVLTVSNPEISQMIRSLAIADAEHHKTLKTFAQRRQEIFD
ncbi:MAG: hypothetical protein V2I67_04225 [Thermoanaerobaculales bacterium]|jgi:rubrerythrin|nr:hypothetical protein [Thermoanaerobaculales bacterium]